MNCININSTKIFLNTFGFVLQDDKGELNIYNSNNTNVGYIVENCIGNDIVSGIESHQLLATNTLHTQVHGRRNRIVVRSNVIKFNIIEDGSNESVNKVLSGFMRINAYKSQEANINYGASFNATYKDSKGKIVTFSMNEGNIFRISVIGANSEEIFEIDRMRYRHLYHIREFDEKLKAFPYNKEVTISYGDNARLKIDETKIDKGKVIQIRKKDIGLSKPVSKMGDFPSYYDALAIYTIKLIHQEDAFVAKRIIGIKETLRPYGDLFKNLVSLCYEDYSDKFIYELFGVERNDFYQDGALNLEDACEGIKSDVKVNTIGQRE